MSAPIRDLLTVFKPEHAAQAKQYFASLPPDAAITELRSLAQDADPRVRSYSIIIAGELFPEQAAPLAATLLRDDDPTVRWQACKVVHFRRYTPAASQLVHIVGHDEYDFVRDMAALALSETGDPSILPALEQASRTEEGTDHEGQPIRVTIERSIERIRSRFSGTDPAA